MAKDSYMWTCRVCGCTTPPTDMMIGGLKECIDCSTLFHDLEKFNAVESDTGYIKAKVIEWFNKIKDEVT